MKGAAAGKTVVIRSPHSVRPWQHVLEPLSGYLMLGARLLDGDVSCAGAYNFGPENSGVTTVLEAANILKEAWDDVKFEIIPPENAPHEAKLLLLDASKAYRELGWKGVWNTEETLLRVADWYRKFYCSGIISTSDVLADYIECAKEKGLSWIK